MSNIITIETDIEPPLVAVALSGWNALNQAYAAALARAEAAENDLRELRENTLLALGHNRPALEDIMKLQHPPNGHRLKQELAAALARAEAAEKRVAELEARLAEEEWRSVTEPPIEEGEYWGWDAHDGVFITHYNPDRDYDDDWAWSDWSGEMIPVDMWSPLIPPPPPSNSTGLAP